VVVRNYQVIHLSSASFTSGGILNAEATEENLQEAIAMLEAWPFVGIVERFSESIKLLNLHLKRCGFNFLLDEMVSNQSHHDDHNEKLDRSCAVKNDFLALNKLDKRLYEYFLVRHEKSMKEHFNCEP